MRANERTITARAVHVARLHRRVLTRRPFAVVLVADRDPRDAGLLVRPAPGRAAASTEPSRTSTPCRAASSANALFTPMNMLPRDVREVAAVLEPRPGRRDVVGGALAHRLQQHPQAGEVVAVPRRERLEQLEPVGVGRHDDRRPPTGRRPAGWNPDSPGSKPFCGQLVGRRAARARTACRRPRRTARARSRRRAGR